LHVFIGEILADMTQVSDVAPGPLVFRHVQYQCVFYLMLRTCVM
jgi:hypothetical protein